MTYRFDKVGMHREQEYILREDSLGSQMSKSQLLTREWSEDMAQNVRRVAEKALAKAERAKARSEKLSLKLRKLRKWPPCGRPKAAK
eukprot:4477387-Prymnesium_polylepis.1